MGIVMANVGVVSKKGETAGPSTSVGMTILWYPQHVNRDTLQPSNRIVIPTEVEGPAVSLPRSPFHPPWVGKAGGQLYGEPHTWSLPAFAKWEIRVSSGPNEQTREGPHGRADSFPTSRQKRARYGAHPQLWLGESFNGCRLASEFARYDQVVATAGLSFPRN
jgi:hypothetical protein